MLAAADHVEAFALVPPERVSVMLDWPLVTSEVRMFSMEAAVRAHPLKALVNAVATSVPVVLNMFAGNEERFPQNCQAALKLVPDTMLIAGNDVSPLQLNQVLPKLVTALVLSSGNEVKPGQPFHVC